MRALARRFKDGHPAQSKINEDLSLREAGYRGERNLDYYLSFLEERDFYFIHDLRLQAESGHFFQMDTVVLHSAFVGIIEAKNTSGNIQFQKSPRQVVRQIQEKEQVISNPHLQVKRQRLQLMDWLLFNGWPLLPIYEFVAFTNPLTKIHSDSPRVTHAEDIPHLLGEQQQRPSSIKLDQKQIQNLSKMLVLSHQKDCSSIVPSYKMSSSDIQTGVQCPKCESLQMRRGIIQGGWQCEMCHNISKDAHIQALEDFLLLVQPTITNRQFRDFLQISSSKTAYRLLSQLSIPRTHSNKHSFYTLSYPLHKR